MDKKSAKSRARKVSEETLREIIVRDLPELVRKDPILKEYLSDLVREKFAEKGKTEEDIREILRTLNEQNRRLAEQYEYLMEQNRRIKEHNKMLEEQNRRLEEHSRILQEQTKRLEEHNKRLEEYSKRLEEYSRILQEQNKRLEEHSKRLEEHSKILQELLKEVKALRKDYDRTLGALGTRWGLYSEASFRSGMRAILKESGLSVDRYWAKDEEGKVAGIPDQIELDIVIRNGKVILVEIKSSASKADVLYFWKKGRFYEEREGVKVDRMILISPMVEPKALETAKNLGIDVYTWPEEVEWCEKN